MTTRDHKNNKKSSVIDGTCYHCGLSFTSSDYVSIIQNEPQSMCCAGCKAVADAIVSSGMESYYYHRENTPEIGKKVVPEFLQTLQAYDDPHVQKQFVHNSVHSESIKEVSLILEGIACSACIWLNEQYLNQLSGVVEVKINYSTHRAKVKWDNNQIQLSEILESISRIGYFAYPYDPAKQQQVYDDQRSSLLKQLGLAALAGAQVMIFSVALYGGEHWGISEQFKILFSWLALLLTLPVLLYSARPFFKGAFSDLKNKRAGMDVPVTLGITLAFIASLYNTVFNTGDVYFDSVCMFVFFLLSVRYIELMARKKSAENIERLSDLSPAMANIVTTAGKVVTKVVSQLNKGDHILIRSGEGVPADGVLLSQSASMDEALLTGESLAVEKQKGDKIIAGSINLANTIDVKVTNIGQETVMSGILRLVEAAQSHKPKIALLADKIASKFIVLLLLLVAATGIYWAFNDPSQALQIMVATLVVSCPCALSLATPAAVSATIGKSVSLGVLVAKTDVMELLPSVDVFLFDKTGTLTEGLLTLDKVDIKGSKGRRFYTDLACTLESRSEHPIATAFATEDFIAIEVADFMQQTGKGLSASYQGESYFLGSLAWMKESIGQGSVLVEQNDAKAVYLFDKENHLATFYLNDPIKSDAKQTIAHLQSKGKKVILLSGDQESTVKAVAKTLGVDDCLYEQLPDQKLHCLNELQKQGLKVAMVGDGINDAPVLAAADIAIAISGGTDLASATSDLIINGTKTEPVVSILNLSGKMNRIIKQNFAWAIGYNLSALPFAMSGVIPPWLAAIGMSLSSLIVVINAMRLKY